MIGGVKPFPHADVQSAIRLWVVRCNHMDVFIFFLCQMESLLKITAKIVSISFLKDKKKKNSLP